MLKSTDAKAAVAATLVAPTLTKDVRTSLPFLVMIHLFRNSDIRYLP